MPENRMLSAEIIGRAIDLTPVSRATLFTVIVVAAGFFFDSIRNPAPGLGADRHSGHRR